MVKLPPYHMLSSVQKSSENPVLLCYSEWSIRQEDWDRAGWDVRGSNPGWDFLFSKTIQTGSGVYPASYPVRTCVLSRGQSDRGVKLTTHIHLGRRLRMSGAVRLSPPVCLRGMDRYSFTLRDCHVLAYFGSASLVDTLLWFILTLSLLMSYIYIYIYISRTAQLTSKLCI